MAVTNEKELRPAIFLASDTLPMLGLVWCNTDQNCHDDEEGGADVDGLR